MPVTLRPGRAGYSQSRLDRVNGGEGDIGLFCCLYGSAAGVLNRQENDIYRPPALIPRERRKRIDISPAGVAKLKAILLPST